MTDVNLKDTSQYDLLCSHYEDLVNGAVNFESRLRKNLLAGLSPFKYEGSSDSKQFLSRVIRWHFDNIFSFFTTPLRFSATQSRFIYELRIFYALLSTFFSTTFLYVILQIHFKYNNPGLSYPLESKVPDLALIIIMLFYLFVPFLFGSAIYRRIYYILRNYPKNRFHPYYLGLYLGLFTFITLCSFWPLDFQGTNPFEPVFLALSNGISTIAKSYTLSEFILIFLGIYIPAYTYVFSTMTDFFSWVSYIILLLYESFTFYHQPVQIEIIKDLAVKKIQGSKEEWILSNQPIYEISLLKEWAVNNRESTDKRLLPSILIVSFLQFVGWNTLFGFINIEAFFNNLSNSVKFTNPVWLLNVLLWGVVIAIVLRLLSLPIKYLYLLFKNFLCQSIIIETCVVAEYYSKMKEQSTPSLTKPKNLVQIILQFLNK